MSALDKVMKARSAERPNVMPFIERLFEDFHECHGDRISDDDTAIIGGVAYFNKTPVTVIGHHRGRNVQENLDCRFGMPLPSGYLKAQRLMKQAEKFNRPVITFIDTPGAYPGKEAEENGQGAVIAQSIMQMSRLRVPTIAIVIGEGGSGGALALSVSDAFWMLENSIYSVVSPEGCASILWKDPSRVNEATEALKLTAEDLVELGICDKIISERFAFEGSMGVFATLEQEIDATLKQLRHLSVEAMLKRRYEKYRRIGVRYVSGC